MQCGCFKIDGSNCYQKLKEKNIDLVSEWIENAKPIKVNYKDNTEELLDLIIKKHAFEKLDNSVKGDTSFLRRLIAGEQLETA